MVRYEAAENIRLIIKSCGVGFLLGAVHCFFNIVFGVRKKNTVLKTVGDFLFFVVACTAILLFLLDANNGRLRFFVCFGVGAGFLVFLLLPEKAAVNFFCGIADKVDNIIAAARKYCAAYRKKRKEKTAARIERKKNKKTIEKSNKTLAYKRKDDI